MVIITHTILILEMRKFQKIGEIYLLGCIYRDLGTRSSNVESYSRNVMSVPNSFKNVTHSNTVYMTSLSVERKPFELSEHRKRHLENYLTTETSYSHFLESYNTEKMFGRS